MRNLYSADKIVMPVVQFTLTGYNHPALMKALQDPKNAVRL